MNQQPFLGVCYYPEHWPEDVWARDAKKMAALGIKRVRIGEFAWSHIEPSQGHFEWAWLDRAINTLGDNGLEIMLGTPTATPPKWLVDTYPDILACDSNGQPRTFGSRRHYCFSSETYLLHAARIVEAIAQRYGEHPAITAWQTDNEYGCHDTIRSYSPAATIAFRHWLKKRYTTIKILNEKWGTVFWSQEYRTFDEVDLPNRTVTEPNPSHVLDFYRFSSDQVVRFNRQQTDIIRQYSPGRPIVHNFMGFFFSFDHFAVANDLDEVGWDSYPIGFLDVGPFSPEDKARYLRQGHPDIAAFHHDLYRAVGRGRWHVLEQQPGAVNWAPHNPAPLSGMVRLWSNEAIAHGAQSVNYFRWRQVPFAQEQMHAGLERPDYQPAPGYNEARDTSDDLTRLQLAPDASKASVAIIFSYDAHWLFEAQPQGAGWHYATIVFQWYAALRQLGLNVDFISPEMSFDDYQLILVPSLPVLDEEFIEKCSNANAQILFGARTGSKTTALTIPENLAPGLLQQLMPLKVVRSESFPDFHKIAGDLQGTPVTGLAWLDHVETKLEPLASSAEGGLLYQHDNFSYLTTLPGPAFLSKVISMLTRDAGMETFSLPPDVRLRRRGDILYFFNYGLETAEVPPSIEPSTGVYLIGDKQVPPAHFSVWKAT